MSGLGEEASAGPRCARTAQFRIAVTQIRCPGMLEEIYKHNMLSDTVKSTIFSLKEQSVFKVCRLNTNKVDMETYLILENHV